MYGSKKMDSHCPGSHLDVTEASMKKTFYKFGPKELLEIHGGLQPFQLMVEANGNYIV